MVRPGRYWLITRRTLMRMFLLMPTAWVRELFDYAVSRAASDTGVCVIGGCCMSSHYHLVVFDGRGEVPRFVQVLNELVARAGNVELARTDHFFASGSPHYLPLLTREAIEDALVYALANPCEAGLVARSRAWGGWQTQPEVLGTTRVVTRPGLAFFSERSRSPAAETLTLHLPATHAEAGAEEFRRRIARRLRAREEEIRGERRGGFLGMDKVLSFHWSERARAEEPVGGPVPKAKTGRIERAPELHRRYAVELALFWEAYREAFERMRAGEAAVFPYGTYAWRIIAGRTCADPPTDDRAVFA